MDAMRATDQGPPTDPGPPSHAVRHRVRFDECDAGGAMRPSSLLRVVQDLAWQHSDAVGFDRHWYAAHGLTWLVRGVDLHLGRRIESGSTLHLSTGITGLRRVWARRETIVRAAGIATPVADTVIDWVLVDDAGRPTRVPPEVISGFHQEAPSFAPATLHLPVPGSAVTPSAWHVRNGDLDPMAHVNNATYLDVMDEAIAALGEGIVGPQAPVRYQVEYVRAAQPRSTVVVDQWGDGPATAFRLTDAGGQELIRARVTPG